MNELEGRILFALHEAYKARPNYPGTRSDDLMVELGITDDQYVVAIKSLIAKSYVEAKGTQQHRYFWVKITPKGNELVEATPPLKTKKRLGFVG